MATSVNARVRLLLDTTRALSVLECMRRVGTVERRALQASFVNTPYTGNRWLRFTENSSPCSLVMCQWVVRHSQLADLPVLSSSPYTLACTSRMLCRGSKLLYVGASRALVRHTPCVDEHGRRIIRGGPSLKVERSCAVIT